MLHTHGRIVSIFKEKLLPVFIVKLIRRRQKCQPLVNSFANRVLQRKGAANHRLCRNALNAVVFACKSKPKLQKNQTQRCVKWLGCVFLQNKKLLLTSVVKAITYKN